MPMGLIVMLWNERKGAEVIAKYPAEFQVSEKSLMQIVSTHEYDSEPGTLSMALGAMNAVSYYAGSERGTYVVLFLAAGEDPDAYEDGVLSMARDLLSNTDEPIIKALVPSLFQRLSNYPSLKLEQKLATYFTDKTKCNILSRLEDEGVLSKSELAIWLKDVEHTRFIDINALVSSFVKDGLAKEVSIKDAPSELIFLIRDIFITRIPPSALIRGETGAHGMPASFKEKYLQEVQTFFKGYKPTLEDNIKLADVILDQQSYEGLELMRHYVVSREDLEKLKKKGVEDVDALLKKFWDNKLITVLHEKEGRELFALIADISIERHFPTYLLNIIRKNYVEKSKSNPVLLEHLNILKEIFWEDNTKKSKRTIALENIPQ